MILQALYDYYQRKAAAPDSNIAPEGFEWKEIPFVIVIDKEGNFVALEDTREGDGKKKRAKPFLVPAAEKKTVGIKANLLWDNVEYALGANPRDRKDIDARKNAFLNRLHETFSDETSASFVAPLIEFLQHNPMEQINSKESENELLKELLENNANVTFRVLGSQNTNLCETMKPYILKNQESDEGEICLVSGNREPIARLNVSIKGVRGAQSSGAALVSFNLKAFESYGKSQNFNAPMGEPAAFAYTTVLNLLLGKDSKNKVQAGDATTVFWAKKPTVFEDIFPSFFAFPPKDDPDTDVRAVKALYDGVFTGHTGSDSLTRFYVLGLAPNAARLSVRFWHEGVVQDFAEKIRQHFDDLNIIRSPKDNGRYALFWILSAMALENKVDNVPPNLSGQIVQAVLTGSLYPATMLQQTIRRVRATRDVTRIQAGILKAYLNRYYRIHSTKEKEITVALDTANNNPGYRLGRLFAVLEKIQEEANPGLNATIRDRFYGAASSSPVTVFPQLLKLKNHHLAKLENVGRKINFERMLTEIFDGIGSEMPPHLSMEDQSRFAIGYYHQRQALFSSSSNNENKKEG
ncbi:MAG: type I-C CRISPR-associated protein Cas8c/Csd1 [Chlorobiaceae bacterium]|jgi:CRISPR-associated protein Csd1|nr:type I-C CRISPR-associated protein Cas8c/Csd1 [Chlorobiaceae bacterium]NTV16606.1 type I-C CRISPR-associated protein Cas8c/Csd1 [Chlorobiaceae bacterium]